MGAKLDLYTLGGCGGFGMNATILAVGGDAILVDFGAGFPREPLPGAALVVPDGAALVERFPRLAAIALTHAHDDHCAALSYLPPAWRSAPVYGPAFALASAADRLDDNHVPRPRMIPVAAGERVELGPFGVTFVPATHSVPDSALLAIETPVGLVVHSGDFKLDPAPRKGPPAPREQLAELGRRGVRLLLVDSTGALRPGRTAAESSVAPALARAIEGAEGQVFVSTFASHVHRIEAAIEGAAAAGRKVALLGQRMTRSTRHALDLGQFDAPAGTLVSPEELQDERPEGRVWLAGGCQGEKNSTFSRLSMETDQRAEVMRGDTVVLSSSIVPGNEMPVSRMIDRFLRLGAAVLGAGEHPELHASGHGSRDELAELVALTQPEVVVPVHGDRAHLEAMAALAEAADPAPRQVLIIEKGDHLELGGFGAAVVERLEVHTLYLDDAGLVLSPQVMRERQAIAAAGVALVHVRRTPGGRVPDDAVRIEGFGVPGWETIGPEAADAALRAVRLAPPWTPVGELEADIARRVGNLLRRGGRVRPRVVVVLD